ncbi:MAG: hypothetical protein WAX04_10915 [Oscillospiraceae bacterium]
MADYDDARYYIDTVGSRLIQIRNNGDIAEFNHEEKSIQTYHKQNIVDVTYNCSKSIDEKQMIIYANGDIYMDSKLKYEGEKIGKIEGAVGAAQGGNHAAIVTKDRKLYVYGDNSDGALGIPEIKTTNGFILNEEVEDVVKVICGFDHTFVLNSKGEIFGCGTWLEKTYTSFVKFDVASPIVDIACTGSYYNADTVIALNNKGNVYEIGYSFFGGRFHTYRKELGKIDFLSNIVSFSTALNKGAAIDNKGKIYCWGSRLKGKAAGEELKKKIYRISGVEKVFCGYSSVYAIKDKQVFLIPIPK